MVPKASIARRRGAFARLRWALASAMCGVAWLAQPSGAAPGPSTTAIPPAAGPSTAAPVPTAPVSTAPVPPAPTVQVPAAPAPTAPAPTAPAMAACTGSIDGHVIDDTSHEPVNGASVTVGATAEIETDDKGHFFVSGLCPGELTITAGRIDYIAASKTLTIRAGALVSLEIEVHVINNEVIEVKGHA
ncbi:MAG TPA: carboxypeptidase regulatory-like domain-containing protein, partial [Kofleriaceae bacterium]|nr:carboxypeptidase regulatory-like domain-containing protein [Kofleriaceae bacterium]